MNAAIILMLIGQVQCGQIYYQQEYQRDGIFVDQSSRQICIGNSCTPSTQFNDSIAPPPRASQPNILRKSDPNIVCIFSQDRRGATATGFVVKTLEDGFCWVLTADHTVRGLGTIFVEFEKGQVAQASILTGDVNIGVAVLYVKDLRTTKSVVKFASVMPPAGTPIQWSGLRFSYSSGSRQTIGIEYSKGIIKTVDEKTFVYTADSYPRSGNSGGPILATNSGGGSAPVVGIVNEVSVDEAYSIQAPLILAFLRSISSPKEREENFYVKAQEGGVVQDVEEPEALPLPEVKTEVSEKKTSQLVTQLEEKIKAELTVIKSELEWQAEELEKIPDLQAQISIIDLKLVGIKNYDDKELRNEVAKKTTLEEVKRELPVVTNVRLPNGQVIQQSVPLGTPTRLRNFAIDVEE